MRERQTTRRDTLRLATAAATSSLFPMLARAQAAKSGADRLARPAPRQGPGASNAQGAGQGLGGRLHQGPQPLRDAARAECHLRARKHKHGRGEVGRK